jgi:amino acid adenylation domain-containing protein
MTEAASQIAANPLAARKLNSVGRAAGAEIAIMDGKGRLLSSGQRGEIALRGPTLTRGYPNDSEATARAFQHGWFRTGDLGYLDEDEYLFILGRLTDVINRGGQKVAPAEVEYVLLTHEAVAEAAVFAIPHPRLGENVGAAVVLRSGIQTTPVKLREFTRKRLAAFKVPNVIRILPEIPKGANGKINRSGLAVELSLRDYQAMGVSPRSDLEKDLVSLWSQLLELESIGVNQDVLALGADSITIVQMLSRLRQRLGVDLAFEDLLNAPTVAALAKRIGRCDSSSARPSMSARAGSARPRHINLSFQQQRVQVLSSLAPIGSTYHVLEVTRLSGPLDADALRASLRQVCVRHEILRSTFLEHRNEAIQVVGTAQPELECLDPGPVTLAARGRVIRQNARAALHQPFDLRTEPPLRARLLRFDERDHALILVVHHIATDGWSQELFWTELWSFYSAALDGTRAALPPLRLQYRNFVEWQRKWLATDAAETQRHYWHKRLGKLMPLPLRTEQTPREQRTGRGARYSFRFSRGLTRRIKLFSHRHNVTVFMTLLTAFQSVLHRYTGHNEVTLGSVFANRNRIEFEPLIGMFANTVILQTDFSGDPTVREVLDRVRKTTAEAQANSELPIEEVLRLGQPSLSVDRHAPFRCMFIFQKKLRIPSLSGLGLQFLDVDPGTAHVDLLLELREDGERLGGWLEYDTDLFDAATVSRIAGHLRILLDAMITDTERRISRLDLIPRRERELLEDWSRGRAEPRGSDSFAGLFAAQAKATPAAVAVSTGSMQLSYSQLEQRSRAMAARLAQESVGPETIVVLLAQRDVNFLAALVAVQWVGAAFLPLDPTHPGARLAHIITSSRAPIVLTSAGCAEWLAPWMCGLPAGSRPKLLDLAALAQEAPKEFSPPVLPAPSSLAYVIYTSGSTGTPKGAMIEQQGLLNHLLCKVTDMSLSSGDVVAQTAPQSFDISIWQFLAPLLAGARVHICANPEVQDLTLLADMIGNQCITVLQVVPTVLHEILELTQDPQVHYNLRRLRVLLVTGEAVSPKLVWEWFRYFPCVPVINAYGPAECADDVATHYMISGTGLHTTVPIGRPIANTRLYVLDTNREPVPIGVVGELYVGGIGVGRGYLNDAERTRGCFLPDPFEVRRGARLYRTGDLARWRADGTLEFLGRDDDQVKLRGYRIELGEIERTLLEHPGVEAAAVLLRDDHRREAQLVAYWVPTAVQRPEDGVLRSFLKSRLPGYMVPVGYVCQDRLPLTMHGKVDRKALQAGAGAISAQGSEARARPRTTTEQIVADIWKEVLGLKKIGAFANFFDLGGHSLLAGKVLARLTSRSKVALPLRAFFAAPTVEGVARAVDEACRINPDQAMIQVTGAVLDGARTISITLEHLLSSEWAMPGLPQYNLPFAYRLHGRLNVIAVKRSISELIRRHEALRTAFRLVNGRAQGLVTQASALPVPLFVEDLVAGFSTATAYAKTLLLKKARLRAEQESWTPFDISRAPLFRVRLLRLGPDDHVLVLVLHHAIVDSWSIGMLLEELAMLYKGFASGDNKQLLEPATQFSNFTCRQRKWSATPAAGRQLSYWRDRLRGYKPLFSRPRLGAGDVLTDPVDQDPILLPSELVQAITTLSRDEGVTPFVTLLAGFKVLLMAKSGRTDICVATAMANRSALATERTIGLLENTTVIRTTMTTKTRFREALGVVSAAVMEAYERQELPFGTVASQLNEEFGLDPCSLIQAFFIMRNAWSRPFKLPNVAVRSFGDRYRQGMAVLPLDRTWITVSLKPAQSHIIGSCSYKAGLFGLGPSRYWSRTYRTILQRAVENSEAILYQLVAP